MPLEYMVPNFPEPPHEAGLVKLVDAGKPCPAWPIDPDKIEPEAIPTPFARAERIAASFRAAGMQTPPEAWKSFNTLLCGVSLGILRVEMVDLSNQQKTRIIGEVLSTADPAVGYRYFGFIKGKISGKDLIFGGTGPECLFWPHPRRTGDDWNQLANLVNQNPSLNDAKSLWAEWRQLLSGKQLWKPRDVAWMKGVDWSIGETPVKPGILAQACRTAGPVRLMVPDPAVPGQQRLQRLYLPVYDPQIASDLFRSLFTTLEAGEAEEALVLQDVRRNNVRRIFLPAAGQASALHLGAGTAGERAEDAGENWPEPKQLNLKDWQKKLNPVFVELQNEASGKRIDLAQVRDIPIAYPDVVRLVSLRLGAMGFPHSGIDCSYSQQAVRIFIEKSTNQASPDFSFRLPMPHEIAENAGAVVRSGSSQAVYLEECGGAIIGDLSAIGFAMWAVFSGLASVQDGVAYYNGPSMFNTTTTPARPFEVHPKCYESVRSQEAREAVLARLATLQRFSACYSKRFDETAGGSGGEIEKLFHLSFIAFINRFFPDVKAQGPVPREIVEIKLSGGTVKLARG